MKTPSFSTGSLNWLQNKWASSFQSKDTWELCETVYQDIVENLSGELHGVSVLGKRESQSRAALKRTSAVETGLSATPGL